jgi:hypothetical protein
MMGAPRLGPTILALAGLLAGCAAPLPARAPTVPAAGRVLVVARATSVQGHAVALAAAERLAAGLRESAAVVGGRDLLEEAGGTVAMARLLERLERGGTLAPGEGAELRDRFRIGALLAVEVTAFDQVWGKYAKFTRVGVAVERIDLASGEPTWRAQRDTEIEHQRGRAFQYALERAVADLVDAIDPRTQLSPIEVWRYWRR